MTDFNNIPKTWIWRAAKAKISVTELASRAGSSQTHISDCAKDKRSPGLKVFAAIERELAKAGEPFNMEYLEDV